MMSRSDASTRVGRWVAILAGGDGVRLRALTRRMTGDDRPKQFCPLVGTEPLLTETRRRAALVVPPHRTLAVVTRPHEEFYRPLLADMRTPAVVVQPENRGTAPAILYTLLRIACVAPQHHSVAFFRRTTLSPT
jgi:mannose-1-phosphate guanylyltransferase